MTSSLFELNYYYNYIHLPHGCESLSVDMDTGVRIEICNHIRTNIKKNNLQKILVNIQ